MKFSLTGQIDVFMTDQQWLLLLAAAVSRSRFSLALGFMKNCQFIAITLLALLVVHSHDYPILASLPLISSCQALCDLLPDFY
jgi:hypothetical protein